MISFLVQKSEAKYWKDVVQNKNKFLKNIGIISGPKLVDTYSNQFEADFLKKCVLIPTSYNKEDLPKDILDCPRIYLIEEEVKSVQTDEKLQIKVLRYVSQILHTTVSEEQYPVPSRFVIYPPLALLSLNSFGTKEWHLFFQSYANVDVKAGLFDIFAREWNVSHIAINEPIPVGDVMRRPLSLKPLYGDFGVLIDGNPSEQDFQKAFWVSCRQNGIYQTWAPLYTMFSRGNSIEKARVLNFSYIKDEIIADLYAGIGYFTFSYVKAGASTVFCWEINPWSVEALRRAALKNGWSIYVVQNGENYEFKVGTHRIVVFLESNVYAAERFSKMNISARHINLGMLPSSEKSWSTATSILKRESHSFIHVHENVKDEDIETYSSEVNSCFSKMLAKNTVCVTNCVKSFSPRVSHIVYDIETV
ncbi:tRNA(Phe) (4-demethylwyosine(37)-C(7)) aminocarboxypropyltransferase [Schizosaccharomyces pombe]